ncbi:hypothetical protein Mapa_010703 [Marchantia paleacea]|nr:hypothetical protein Mapa_010703 [Marchantia paleacea]
MASPLNRGSSLKVPLPKASLLTRTASFPTDSSQRVGAFQGPAATAPLMRGDTFKAGASTDSSSVRWGSMKGAGKMAASTLKLAVLLFIGVYLYGAVSYARSIRYPSRVVTTEMLYRRLEEAGDTVPEHFHLYSCPQATFVVSELVNKFVTTDPNLAGGLEVLQFHDCFVRGCDASILLNSTSATTPEKDASPKADQESLRGFEQIDKIRAALEEACPDIVTCADILALVARDPTLKVGGPSWSVVLGRREGFVFLEAEAKISLPSPLSNFSSLVQNFELVKCTMDESSSY